MADGWALPAWLGAPVTHGPGEELRPIGRVRSRPREVAEAPSQGDEGAGQAWLDLTEDVAPALEGLAVGDRVIVLTWLHHACREVRRVHPRGDATAPSSGVFATRSPHRPNPIGLHAVDVLEVGPHGLRVAPLEAVEGTPVLDVKPALLGQPWGRPRSPWREEGGGV